MLKVALRGKWIWALVLALVLASGFAFLANWQFSRAQERSQQVETADTETVRPFLDVVQPQQMLPSTKADQMVSLSGHYNPEQQVVVPGREQGSDTGFWVVTMFVPDGAEWPGHTDDERDVAIPVVRGWTASEDEAMASVASAEPVMMTARLTPTESPEPADSLPKGQVATLSTAQLINDFDVLSYPAFLLPTQQEGAGASAATSGLEPVPAPAPQPGGINLQSLFYGIEWVVFALFALYIWWRMVRDVYQREQETALMADNGYDVVQRNGRESPDAKTALATQHLESKDT
ncbi:SURF1 family cytochrome oxidase biogenesis protein [Saxibacter everestensis]|uniref:SURF1-like protein n=1 Tax=Saxibacter everestensis TaxID=2909229 RepID=A0ABY8QWS4_9MICO|nr:SURF1 family cytochrome oxidase biogenesis protein [Brevibacteriaceae bacterium ZFBP1038]